jgi:hypothetical protein
LEEGICDLTETIGCPFLMTAAERKIVRNTGANKSQKRTMVRVVEGDSKASSVRSQWKRAEGPRVKSAKKAGIYPAGAWIPGLLNPTIACQNRDTITIPSRHCPVPPSLHPSLGLILVLTFFAVFWTLTSIHVLRPFAGTLRILSLHYNRSLLLNHYTFSYPHRIDTQTRSKSTSASISPDQTPLFASVSALV